VITTRDLPFHLKEGKPEGLQNVGAGAKGLNESLEAMEKDLILKALQEHHGVQTKAAESLGISERVLRYKMKKYKLRLQEVKES
jgi:transcriptional regulator with PAS, ATPase and Fis domain